MKKFISLGLKSEYEKNGELSSWFKMVCCLAIVPLDYVDKHFENVLLITPDIPKADVFLKYVVDTYFKGVYKVSMWNHFNTNETPRTNNNLEGYNFRLNKHLSVSRPNIYTAINKLKEEEVDASLKFFRALNGNKAPPRNKLYVINDVIFLNQRQMLLNNEISVETYIKYSIKVFDFAKLEKKLDKIDECTDDDSAESLSDISTSDDQELSE
ncbi:unnamed protein product [Brachionus calyciflorus]|uniref:Uncharacterized protein n=1 Tax=Brachionus calyciflorus TaxID=104777 RepID=A0A813QGJ9_9BILA|nr:unnamed protein product [Brachionus calyciflorus]